MQLTALQFTSSPDPQHNLATIRALCAQLPPQRPQLVVLPEAALCFGAGDQQQRAFAELDGDGPLQRALSAIAQDFAIWLVAGTLPLLDYPAQQRFSAASLVFDASGQRRARYDKIHLFDVEVADSTGSYRESASTQPGQHLVTLDTGHGVVGFAVCYDLRFAEQFRLLRQAGAEIIVLPSAFTQVTGAAHWHVLTRARAIEQQCALVAAAQVGRHANGRETYGHALIIDSWGQVVADAGTASPSLVSAAWDRAQQQQVRQRMPVLTQLSQQQVYACSTVQNSSK